MKIHPGKKTNKNHRKAISVGFLFFCLLLTPAVSYASLASQNTISPTACSITEDQGDIPTWCLGDQWIYKVQPLSFSSPNGSFNGKIENFKQNVVQKTTEAYVVSITGDISGDIDLEGFSGDLTGQIMGTSSIRVSDLAEITTELHSTGQILVMWIPFPYELHLVTSSSPALELYDFPFRVGEEWQLACQNSVSGYFSIQGVYQQQFDGSQWIDETVTCMQKKQVTVPAGTFDCYEIGRSDSQAWFSTDVGNVVRSSIDQSDENMSVQMVLTLQSYSRAAQPITVSQEITPAMVAPGASVCIAGQAVVTSSGSPVQNGAITIQIPSTGDSWQLNTDSSGYYTKTINAPTMIDDTASGRETGSGGVIVSCTSGSLSGYRVQTLTTMQDTAPATPSIQGPTKGKKGVTYNYTFSSMDSENDDVSYYVDWGDGTYSGWVGPSASNQQVTLSHTFTKKGSYIIKAKARDVFFAESDWASLEVSMPKNFASLSMGFSLRYPLLSFILQRFLWSS